MAYVRALATAGAAWTVAHVYIGAEAPLVSALAIGVVVLIVFWSSLCVKSSSLTA